MDEYQGRWMMVWMSISVGVEGVDESGWMDDGVDEYRGGWKNGGWVSGRLDEYQGGCISG